MQSIGFRLVPKLVTLNDLERRNGHVVRVISPISVAFATYYVKVVEDTPYILQLKCSLKNLVFSGISFMAIFAGHPQRGHQNKLSYQRLKWISLYNGDSSKCILYCNWHVDAFNSSNNIINTATDLRIYKQLINIHRSVNTANNKLMRERQIWHWTQWKTIWYKCTQTSACRA